MMAQITSKKVKCKINKRIIKQLKEKQNKRVKWKINKKENQTKRVKYQQKNKENYHYPSYTIENIIDLINCLLSFHYMNGC